MRVLVTGGAGFIGRYVCEHLQDHGHEPVVMDRRGHIDADFKTILGDVRDEVSVTEAMARCEGFIHLAAVLGTQETVLNPRPAAEVNILGGLNILQAAAQYSIPGVYIGVGNYWMQNPYSITKTTVERFIEMYNRDRGTCVNIVRVVNAYGPRQVAAAPYGPSKVRKITPSFVCRALANDPIEIYGDGQQVSDMVYVGDVAKALVCAFEAAYNGQKFSHPVEVGPKKHTTVLEMAELVIELAESKSEIEFLPMRPGEIPGASVTAKTETMLQVGMKPESLVPLRAGLGATIDWFRSL